MLPETLKPPSLCDLINMILFLSAIKLVALFMPLVLTKLLNKASACSLEDNTDAVFTPFKMSPETFTFVPRRSTPLFANILPSMFIGALLQAIASVLNILIGILGAILTFVGFIMILVGLKTDFRFPRDPCR